MTTTSLKLPDDIKQRVTNSAQEQGISPHAFMLQAIEQAVSSAELQAKLFADARKSHLKTLQSGEGYDAEEVHAYIKARIRKQTADRPKIKNWRS